MTWMTEELAVRTAPGAGRTDGTRGIAAGTIVLTLEGAFPVEFLVPGDRVITRTGLCILRDIKVHRYSGPAIRLRAGALGHDRPDQDLLLPDETPIVLRDWRARALFGAPEVVVPIRRVADGEFVAPTTVLSMRVFDLRFDTAEVVYAEGLELVCEPARCEMASAAG
ncbi:hypothetical protein DEA8626_01128 [Defluviimonas aquaemixtae]|uniref:Hedgehog/Intein (Hint) domain-containing protein n=1 Tax=Albidovulum aquaemixtae TaxID=1542388 RepID=A0A2R8B4Q8_9RHOB|nr:Hint domain-containing protein [Defluviimonas aquaemixtae]SPH17605.1 hypothetical protein DEA8626_01128 [Defluviimonas aquaemixtae]